jgi:arylsulfatase A-like enzyme
MPAMRILYLDLDTLRPDHLGCYGYERNTSPNIDRIAAEGVRFEGCHCSDAPCAPSRTALMTGRFGIHTGLIGHGGTAGDMRLEGPARSFRTELTASSLPALLKEAGLYTCFIGGFAERHSLYNFYAGFREIHDTGMGGMESAEDVTPAVLDWIARNATRDDWYLHVNYWDPHTPYRAPAAFGNPFAGDPLPAWLTPDVLDHHRQMAGPHGAREINMYDDRTDPRYPRHPGELRDMADLRAFVDGYDCGIAYMDGHIGQLLAALEQASVMDDLAIIVSSDHGENLGELGLYGEHATADAITCRVPLIVRWPGGRRGAVDAGLRYNLDLAPTLAELLGRPAKPAWEGQSFAAAVAGGGAPGRDFLVLSQGAHVCQRSVRWEQWLYVRTYHDGHHLFPDEMLFDIAADPHEQTDLTGLRPDLCGEGARRLADWHATMMRSMPAGYTADPMQTVMAEGGPFHTRGRLPAYLDRLRATGRAGAADELARRHPEEMQTQPK